MNYYPFHLGDYAAHTAHLEPMEDLAYRRMLDLYYRTEEPLPEPAEIARLIRMKDHAATVRDILNEFFVASEDGYRHVRCDEEIARMQDKQAKAKASAQASVNARSAKASLPSSTPVERPFNERSTEAELPTPTPTPKEIPSNLSVAPALPGEGRPALALVAEPAKQNRLPDCPHLAVLALWAEVLPTLPQHLPSQWKGARADHLRARWRETAAEKRWASEADGLAYLRKLFGYVGTSEFLTGRAKGKGARPFFIELEWLVNPTNWAKVIEGKYHGEAA